MRRARAVGIGLCLSAAGCSGGRADSRPAADAPRRVQVVKAEKRQIPRTVVAVGTLAAEERAELGFKVPGPARALERRPRQPRGRRARSSPSWTPATTSCAATAPARRSSRRAPASACRWAATTTTLDPEPGGHRAPGARRASTRPAVNLDRSRELRDQGILAQAEFDATEAAFKVAQSQYNDALEEVNNRRGILAERRTDLALAEQQLTDTRLRAPFSGAVQQRRANLGEYLAAGAPVLTLVKLTPLRLRLDVPEREAPNVRKGQEVAVRVEGATDAWPGQIVRLSPALEEANRSLIVEAEVDNSQGPAAAGLLRARRDRRPRAAATRWWCPASAAGALRGHREGGDGEGRQGARAPGHHGPPRRRRSSRSSPGSRQGEPVVVKPGNLATGRRGRGRRPRRAGRAPASVGA